MRGGAQPLDRPTPDRHLTPEAFDPEGAETPGEGAASNGGDDDRAGFDFNADSRGRGFRFRFAPSVGMERGSGRRAVGGVVAVAVVVAVALTLAAGPALGAERKCTAADGRKVCLDDVRLSADGLVRGETATLEATVRNAGDAPANVTVVLNTVGPNDTVDTYTLGRTRLAPGETRTVSQSLDASTPGTHGVQLLVVDADGSHRYDASAVRTIVVAERGLGGALDRSEYALGALVGSVGVAVGLVLRRRGGVGSAVGLDPGDSEGRAVGPSEPGRSDADPETGAGTDSDAAADAGRDRPGDE